MVVTAERGLDRGGRCGVVITVLSLAAAGLKQEGRGPQELYASWTLSTSLPSEDSLKQTRTDSITGDQKIYKEYVKT